jgi:hypothetical protein
MNFRISSMTITGALRYKTAFHSTQLSGVIAKRVYGINVKDNAKVRQNIDSR